VRQKIVAGILFGMLTAYGAILAVRPRGAHVAPTPTPAASAGAGSGAAGAAGAAGGHAAGAAAAGATGSAAPAGSGSASVDGGVTPLLDRPLRLIVQGWELAVPGVLANGGLEPSPTAEMARAGLDLRVSVSTQATALENALARGGSDREGADVAVMPLPSFVASYERLRALSPEVFFVVGWSRGREGLMASKDVLASPPSGEIKLAGAAGEPATFVALFALEAAGVPLSQIKLLPPGKAGESLLEAVDRGALAPQLEHAHRTVLLTTADASRLVPFVAVAPHALIERQPAALAALARGWLLGQKQVEADPPAAARVVGAAPNAPGPLLLLKGLGEMTPSPLSDNARAVGLSGRGAVTLEALFQASWRAWRATGLLTTPAPDAAPIATSIIASLVRSDPALLGPSAPGAPAPFKGDAAHARALLVYRQPDGKLAEPALQEEIGLLAGVFERSALRVGIRGGGVDKARTKKAIDAAVGQFDLHPSRLVPAGKLPDRAAASVEVLASP
jgi:hypothetical protein